MRGNAGTHDLELGIDTINALKGNVILEEGSEVRLPRYNKSAFGGKGDRHDVQEWPVVSSEVDIILFEGWMLGFTPLDASDSGDMGDLKVINDKLGEYDSWNDVVDAWMVVRIDDLDYVYDWRMQAERKMRSDGAGGMSDAEVRLFMPITITKDCIHYIHTNSDLAMCTP